jgi:hypothetical protein
LHDLKDALPWFKKMMRSNGLFPKCIERWSPKQVINTRSPCKKETYRRAYEYLDRNNIEHRNSMVKAMIKFEKAGTDKIHKGPRLIQYRGPIYTAELASYIAPVEKRVYDLELNGFKCFAKHMNSIQRAEAIVSMGGPDRAYVMLDHKHYEGHIGVEALKFEHSVYDWLYGHDKHLSEILSWQLRNTVYARSGQKWKIRGTRMSGDYNTSSGANIINLAAISLWAKHIGVPDHELRVLLDGDDCVISLPKAFLENLDLNFFTRYGFEVTLEGIGLEPEEVIFCQTRPIETGSGWRMCRSFERSGARMQYSIRSLRGKGWVRYARGIAQAERLMGDGMPIFAALGRRLCELVPKLAPIYDNNDYYRMWCEPPYTALPVTDTCRASFALAFGISPTEQVVIEKSFATARLADPLFALVDAARKKR